MGKLILRTLIIELFKSPKAPYIKRHMLYLMRKAGESIIINGDIELVVVEVSGKSVKLGFAFPPSASVLRKEVFDRIADENKSAQLTSGDDFLSAINAEGEKND